MQSYLSKAKPPRLIGICYPIHRHIGWVACETRWPDVELGYGRGCPREPHTVHMDCAWCCHQERPTCIAKRTGQIPVRSARIRASLRPPPTKKYTKCSLGAKMCIEPTGAHLLRLCFAPNQIVRASGVYFWDQHGKRYIDWNSMAMCANHGHTPDPRRASRHFHLFPFSYILTIYL